MRELRFNVGGDPKEDVPIIQPDNPAGTPAILGQFLPGATPPNRMLANIPDENTGGAWVSYQKGQKRFRVILPPLNVPFQAEAGEPPQIPPEYNGDADRVALHYAPVATAAEALRPGGRYLLNVLGQRVPWRGITGFRVPHLVATGERGKAEAFLDFCAEHKAFPRMLAMAQHLFQLDPNKGREVMPTVLQMVKDRGIYCEVVSLADTRSYQGLNLDTHVQELGQMCAASGCAIDEIGNELLPPHVTQLDTLTPARCLHLARLVPVTVPVSLGSSHGPEAESRLFASMAKSLPNGYATAHDIRTNEENGWKWVRHPNDLGWIADDTRCFLVSNEPQKLDLTPGKHLGTAAVCRVIRAIGDTIHYQGGLQAQIPTGAELPAFLSHVEGWNIVSDQWLGQYRNAGQGWPVRGFQNGNRCYSSINITDGSEAYSVALDSDAMTIEWHADARPELIIQRDGTRIFRVTR